MTDRTGSRASFGAAGCFFVLVLFAVVAATGVVSAAPTTVVGCTVIDEAGHYELTDDVTDATGACIQIVADDVVFDGGSHTVDGDAGDLDADFGVQLGNDSVRVSNVTVRDVTVTDWQTGVSLTRGEESVIDNVTVDRARGYGVYFADPTSRTTVENSRISGWKGIQVYESTRNTIRNNEIRDTSEFGLQLTRGSQYNTVAGNTITNTSTGVIILGPSNDFSGNVISDNRRSGVGSSSGYANGNTFTDDRIERNQQHGIQLTGSGNTFTNVTIADNGDWDLNVDYNAIDVTDLNIGTAVLDGTSSVVWLDGATTPSSLPSGTEATEVAFNATQGSNGDSYLDAVIQYDDADVTSVDESTVALYRYDGSWTEVSASTIDTTANTVSANVTTFGTFALLADSGTATTEPDISVTPGSVDFGSVDVGSSASQKITVSNAGSDDLTVTDVSLSGADAGEFGESEGGFTLPPGDTRDVTVSFSPTSDGAKSADLLVESNDPDTPIASVSLTGTGQSVSGTPQTDCTVIDAPGVYSLQGDVTDATAQYCFEITASDVVFDGNGYTIDGTNVGDSSAVFVDGTTTAVTNVTVRDLNVTQFSRGVTATNAEVDVSDLTGLPDTGVWTYGADLTLENATFRAGAGVVAEPWNGRESNVTLEAVTIDSFRGVYADEGTLIINNSTLRQADVVDDGIELWNATLELSNTTIESSNDQMGVGVLAQDNSTVHVSHSTFTNNSEGVQLVDSEGTISHSVVENPGKNGLNYTRSTGVASFNTITNSGQTDHYRWAGGIYALESSVTVMDNTVVGGDEHGILVHHSEGLVHNNTVRDTAQWELALVSAHGNVTNNTVGGLIAVFGNTYTNDGEPTATANVTHNTVTSSRNWGVLVDANTEALVAHNDITATIGVAINRGAGANVRQNTIRPDDSPIPSIGIEIDDTQAHPDLPPARSATVALNEINATYGVYVTDTAMPSVEIVLNDLSETEVALRNDNESADLYFNQLNYYGPRGPTDERIVGNWDNVEPFLTDASGIDEYVTAQTTQSFGYDFEFDAGRQYAFGTPGPLSANLSTVFDDFDGAIYLYDSTSDSWTLASGDEVLGPMEAVVVVPTTDARAMVDFADATPARATSRQLDTTGWHFVAPRMHTNAEEAFSTRTVGVTDLLTAFEDPEDPDWGSAADSFGRYTFSPDRTSQGTDAPTVNPFTGYFVYVDDPGTIPGAVPDGVDVSKFIDLLTGGQ